MDRLGESPRVLGTYEAAYPYQAWTLHHQASEELGHFLWAAHPGLDKLNVSQDPWGMMYHPPAHESWAPSSPYVSRGTPSSLVISDALAAALNNNQDLDAVFMRVIPAFPDGITGIGLSAEVRAYIFCHVASLFCPVQDSLVFNTSARCERFLTGLSGLTYTLLRQTLPIANTLALTPPVSSARRWNAVPIIPFTYFLIELLRIRPTALKLGGSPYSTKEVIDLLDGLDQYRADIPMLHSGTTRDTVQHLSRVPLSVVVSWLLVARMEQSSPKAKILVRMLKDTNSGKGHESWLFAATVADVDACSDSLASFGLNQLWTLLRPPFASAMKAALLESDPRCYPNQVTIACRMLKEFFTYVIFVLLRQRRSTDVLCQG